MRLRLKICTGRHAGREVVLTRSKVLIGRGEECHLRLHNERISRLHCQLSLAEGSAWIRDLDSALGTFVNGQRVTRKLQLHTGDLLVVGDMSFEIVVEGEAAERNADLEHIINEDSACEWLSEGQPEASAGALTRIPNKQELAEFYRQIGKPATQNGHAETKTESHDAETVLALTRGIKSLIRDFRRCYPNMSADEVRAAVRAAIEPIEP